MAIKKYEFIGEGIRELQACDADGNAVHYDLGKGDEFYSTVNWALKRDYVFVKPKTRAKAKD